MTDLPTKTYTEFCQGKLPADFSGAVYSDSGRLNYGAVVNGKMLTNKRNMNRWFKYEMEAGRAAYLELQKQRRAADEALLENFNYVGSRHHY